MDPITTFTAKIAALPIENIDTDQIIPKQFLKLLGKTGYGQYLFYNWRYNKEGSPIQNFVLNMPKFKGRKILLTRENFGIGSSREHAVWAIRDFGFRTIVGVSFADIFYNNCFKNGILAIKLGKDLVDNIFSSKINEDLEIDLSNQKIVIGTEIYDFEIDASLKNSLLEGIDEIAMTLKFDNHIKKYEDHTLTKVN
jgi:3-isopropylmalate/(R)-2-methylmalate dehydratase small subunit